MAKYKLFSGEALTSKIEVELTDRVREHVEMACRREWRELHAESQELSSASLYIPYETWSKTPEGSLHFFIVNIQFPLDMYFAKPWAINLSSADWNTMLAQLQTQGRGPRGTRRRYRDGYQDLAAFRRFRSWWLSRALAEKYDLPFNEPCPVEPKIPAEPDFEQIIANFEEWTGYQVHEETKKAAKEVYDARIARKLLQAA